MMDIRLQTQISVSAWKLRTQMASSTEEQISLSSAASEQRLPSVTSYGRDLEPRPLFPRPLRSRGLQSMPLLPTAGGSRTHTRSHSPDESRAHSCPIPRRPPTPEVPSNHQEGGHEHETMCTDDEAGTGQEVRPKSRTRVAADEKSSRLKQEQMAMLARFGLADDEEEEADPEKIRQENERLREERICKVCRDKDSNRLFLPCAHLCSCSVCSKALSRCPLCRAQIRGVVSVFYG